MTRKKLVGFLLGLAMMAPGLALCAEPAGGPGYYGGLHQGTSDVVAFGDQYTTAGLAFGFDYQILLGETFSVNPFLRGDIGSASGGVVDGWDSEHFLLGTEGRWWPTERYFVGGLLAFVDETLTQEAGAILYKNSGSGIAFGVVGGTEFKLNEHGNLMIQATYLKAPGLSVFPNTDIDLSIFRIGVGFRPAR